MRYYIELTLIPNLEISLYFIWEKLYQQVHLALVEQKDENGKFTIGVSFPGYRNDDEKHIYQLGNKLRLFAPSRAELEALRIEKWLSRLSDYVHITSIKSVPDSVTSYASFYRINKRKSNSEKAHANSKRLGISLEQAFKNLEERSEELSKAPFIRMTSLSSKVGSTSKKNQFRLVIGKKEVNNKVADERKQFDSYGLSKTATLPWF